MLSTTPLRRALRPDAVRFWWYAGDATTSSDLYVCPLGGAGSQIERDGRAWLIVSIGVEPGPKGYQWAVDAVPIPTGDYALDEERARAIARALKLIPDCPGCGGEGEVRVAPTDRATCRICNGKRWAPCSRG